MDKREMICIGCPLGCPLSVSFPDSVNGKPDESDIVVTGNTCKNGEIYAKKEILHPERMITSTVPVENGTFPRVSVKTAVTVPKEMIFAVMKDIRRTKLKAPVCIGDVVIRDCAGTGVDIVATGNVEKE